MTSNENWIGFSSVGDTEVEAEEELRRQGEGWKRNS
jgi:hypothetical protein